MVKIDNLPNSKPYELLKKYFYEAKSAKQQPIDAILICSYNKEANEVDARFVNIKYILSEEWIFFSNYNSSKAKDFLTHDQITAIWYWSNIDLQIRIKANIKKTSQTISDKHFSERLKEKNALSISSMQSKEIKSHKKVIENYNKVLKENNLSERPEYWGGYSFTPYYFEFWEGHKHRINRREAFNKSGDKWIHSKLQP